MVQSKKNIILFASGGGSNVQKIVHYFKNSDAIQVAAVFCNKSNAGVVKFAQDNTIPCILFTKQEWQAENFLEQLDVYKPDIIVLAGFLWLVPHYMIMAYPRQIINIHPSLLPAYGGKGMYGHFVHEAVIANKEKESGLTIHLVNEEYDKGKILYQHIVPIAPTDTAETLAQKILVQEHLHFAPTIENYLLHNSIN